MQNGGMPPRRVFVLGAGAIGASVGALLFEAGVDCVFVVRDSEHGRAIVERGVDLRFPNAARTIRVPTATMTSATPDDLILLATMGHETEAALEGADPSITVASFQNVLVQEQGSVEVVGHAELSIARLLVDVSGSLVGLEHVEPDAPSTEVPPANLRYHLDGPLSVVPGTSSMAATTSWCSVAIRAR